MALACIADGHSYIRERIFDKRFSHVEELRKLGANITLDEEDGLAIINGPTAFNGAETRPDNIRAASCILLAGLACPEKTIIHGHYQIGRGHFDIENRFQQLGAKVVRKTL
jgi:UDP-N-acetylglucosamine 1-carboxyvinyltransferase